MRKRKLLISILTGLCVCLTSAAIFTACSEKHTHSYTSQTTTEATCTEKGVITYTCSCNDSYTEEIPATGKHTWGDGKETIAPTCTEKGEKTFTCMVCKEETYTEAIPALKHNKVQHSAQEATCTEKGWNAYETCTRCDYTTYKEIPALKHNKIQHSAQEATCTEKGWHAYETCTRCDYTTYKEIPALKHNKIQHSAQEATCTEKGWQAYETCTRCDYTTYKEIPATGKHTWDNGTETKSPTCTKEGITTYTCTVCKTNTKTEPIDKLPHEYAEKWTSNSTYHWHECVCGDKKGEDKHVAGAPATATTPQTCTICGYVLQVETGILFNTLSVDGTKVYGKVSNATTEFSFTNEVTVKGNATYVVDNDKNCDSPIYNKTVDLEIGDNTFYVLEMIGNDVKLFTVTIRRRPMYDVTFDANGGTSVQKQVIEEDELLIEPETMRTGYTFTGWDYDFTQPIKQTTKITANWSINQYTISFVANNGQMVDSITQDYGTPLSLPIPAWTERSFLGWFDETLSVEFTNTTMPAESVTLYGKWTNYEVFLDVDNLTGLSVNGDLTNGAAYGVTAIDTDNNPIAVTAQLMSGSQTVGTSITVRFVASGLYGVYATQMVSDIKVYGAPTITYNNQKDYINQSDALVASLFTAKAKDSYGQTLNVDVSIKETEYKVGESVTIILSATDVVGNRTIIEIENVKYYGAPIIIRDETVTEIKATDVISNELFGVSATDSFGEVLTVITELYSGTFADGNTITIKSSAIDSKGNIGYIAYEVKVYGLPTISAATKTDFNEGEEITLSSLGITAKDSFNNVLETVTLVLTDGENAAGNTLTYLVTATDHLGNEGTKTIKVKIYATPTISYDVNKTAIKATDKISASLFSATAKDSFGNSLSVTATIKSGEIKGGSTITVQFSAKDKIGNTHTVVTDEIRVYAQSDIALTYNAILSNNIKKSSHGEEFNAVATDTFGEACTITIQPASGFTFEGGQTINLYLVATDKAGNTYTSEIITEKNVYDIPTLSYAREYDYIFANDNPYLLFSVKDSFGADRLFNVEIVSGSLQELGIIVYRITAEDKMGNKLDCTYSLSVTEYDENGFLVCEQDGVIILIDYSSTNEIVVPNGVQAFAKELFTNDTNITSIVLPDSLKELGENAFSGCRNLTSIEIPDSVTSIGENAFYGCYRLTEMTIPFVGASKNGTNNTHFGYIFGASSYSYNNNYVPTSLKKVTITGGSIGDSAFRNCEDLTSVVIPGSVTSIGASAFRNCKGLTGVLIPDSVTSIGNYAFSDCDGLTSVEIPDSVTSIGGSAFYNCSSITSVVIGDGVTSIGRDAFRGCSALTEMTMPKAYYGTEEASYFGYIFGYTTSSSSSIKGATYQGYSEIYSSSSYVVSYYHYYIPQSLRKITITQSIGRDAFYGCSMLTEVVIGDSVTSIGSYAFYNCSALTEIQYNATELADFSSSNYVFYKAGQNGEGITVTIGANVKKIPANMFRPYDNSSYTPKITAVVFEEGSVCESIGYGAFYGCSSLTSVVIPDSVTSIGSSAFRDCSGLTSVEIPDSVTSIGYSAFNGCDSLTSVYITNIGAWCGIDGLSNLMGNGFSDKNLYLNGEFATELIIPDGVASVPARAFSDCSSLTSVVIPDSVTSIGYGAFYGCSSLTSVEIPDSVTSIGSYAFYNCYRLVSEIPDGVTSIGDYAFYNCYCLVSEIPDSVTSIGDYAFYNCYRLVSEIPDGVTSIGDYAFYNCDSLTSIIIPDSVTSIGDYAFYGCSSLTSVKIPDSVTSIGSYAFSNCSSLKSMVIPEGVTSIGNYAFYYCDSLTSVKISDSVISIGSSAFEKCSSLTEITLPFIGETKDGTRNTSFGYIFSAGGHNSYVPTSLKKVTITSAKSIGNYAFSDCSSLTSVVIPDSVTSIGYGAFSDCNSLTSVYITDVKAWCSISFNNDSANPFYRAKNLYLNNELVTELVIPDSVMRIGAYVFFSCNSLTSVVIPNSVRNIGSYAFSECNSLTSVEIGDGVTSIGSYAFFSCQGLTSVEIGNGVADIGNYAFSHCSSLTSMVIPEGVTSIGYQAFYYCGRLRSITFEDKDIWYRTTSLSNWQNKTGGTQTSVTNSSDNVTYFATSFGSTYEKYYWYKV